MSTLHFDSPKSDDERRSSLYDDQLFIYSPRRSTLDFVEFARSLVEEAFGELEPRTAQSSLPVERFADILMELKPKFIHHPESKKHLSRILKDFGCDLQKTYFEVPKLRSSTSDEYLTTGIAYAWHPHRDTWYSAPACQINWWVPIYEIVSTNAMAFHPQYWNTAVLNSSENYNYYRHNKAHRGKHIASYVKSDPRPLPGPLEDIAPESQYRIVCPPGGLIVFSGAQLHSSVPNVSGETRFSFDFRTVHINDLRESRGAPNRDAACSGTVLREFVRASDLSVLPDEIVSMYEDGTEAGGDLTYRPS